MDGYLQYIKKYKKLTNLKDFQALVVLVANT